MSKSIKILVSEEINLAVMFCFEQVFALHMLINKNLLEWFLLIICKEDLHMFSVEIIPHRVFN